MTTYKTTAHDPSSREKKLAWKERHSLAEQRRGELRLSDGEGPLYDVLDNRCAVKQSLREYVKGNYPNISEFEAVHAPMKHAA